MEKKKNTFIMLIFIITLVFVSIGATFAFFTSIRVAFVSPETDVTSATTNTLMFSSGEAIHISATPENFGKDMESLYDNTYALATLIVGSDTKIATYKYNVYLQIDSNNFEYSNLSNKAELIATIYDVNNNEITTLNDLKYINNGNVKGFDITNKKGKFMIAENYEITTTSEVSHRWDLQITFVNLDESQNVNLGKELNGWLVIEPAEGS